MKKIFVLFIFCLGIQTLSAQRILSSSEIDQCQTVEAVAWNFVTSIIEKDWDKMESLASSEFLGILQNAKKKAGCTSYDEYFNRAYIHDIVEMRPLLSQGYKLIITGISPISVYFDCDGANSTYVNDKYDSDTRVIMVQINDNWKVGGFK